MHRIQRLPGEPECAVALQRLSCPAGMVINRASETENGAVGKSALSMDEPRLAPFPGLSILTGADMTDQRPSIWC